MSSAETATGDGRLPGLGRNVRAARTEAGLTTRELAARCGVSQPYVSQIENGRSLPSVVTLLRFAEALEIDLPTLIDGDERVPVSLVRADDSPTLTVADDSRSTARVLTHGSAGVEALEFSAEPGASLGDHVAHAGSDFVYVTVGQLIVDLGDEGVHVLGPGDALSHSGRLPHQWRVGSSQPVEFICVVTPGRVVTPGSGVADHHG